MKIHDETYQMLCGLKGRMAQNGRAEASFDDVILFLANKSRTRESRRWKDNGPAFWGFDAPTFVKRK